LNFEYVPAPRTILKGVRKLEAGEVLVAQRSAPIRRQRYWQLEYEPKHELSWPEAVEGFQERFSRAVERRLMSDVPLGAFLSGGIDSSAIVAMMARHSNRPVQTFSIGFEDSSYDESRYARLVSRHFGTEHHTEVVTSNSLEHIDSVFDDLDEPLADFSTLPTRLLCRLARRNVTVCLSGDGGDELLAGYERHTASLLARGSIDLAPRQLLPLWRGLAAAIPPRSSKKGFWNKAKRFLEGAGRDPEGRQFRWQSFSSQALRERLYGELLRDAEPLESSFAPVSTLLESAVASHSLDRELAVEVGLYLQNDILPKLDMMSMSASLEARVPFLDHELVDFVARLPPALKQRMGRGKVLLRTAMDGVLPREILDRPKEGFGMPVKHWLRRDLYDRFRQSFEASNLDGMLRPEACLSLLEEHREERVDHSHVLWALFSLEEWSRRNLRERESA
ncbi:MAG: asparagine synthase C-terminal domain-containing protein, partial [Myxococcota bacterium]